MQTPFLRIGTRGSKLALYQAHLVRTLICRSNGIHESDVDIEVIRTTGDRIQDRPLSEIGGKGLFTREIEEALIADRIDLAVHSMKDMPAILPEGLVIAAVLEREDPRDAFLSPISLSAESLPQGARVGCSSVRRVAQLLRMRPDLTIMPFRGNVDTRLRKLQEGEVDATFLAVAGLNRLGLEEKITRLVPIEEMLPAPAQGVIGIETRQGNERILKLVEKIHHAPTGITTLAERGFLAGIDGSCRTPVAGYAELVGERIRFMCQALALDGSSVFDAEREGPASDSELLGKDAAAEIKARSKHKLTL